MIRIEPLDEFLAVVDRDPDWVIDRLLATGANVVLVAPYKAGKSTMRDNLVRSLADGEPFLEHFASRRRRVAVIDAELDARTMRRWLRDHGIRDVANVGVMPLRGRVAEFDLLDERVLAEWARALKGFDVLVLDCLRPVLDALGLSEDKDAGRFLVALDKLKRAAGIEEAILVHHAGHASGRARGDSRILDWPDATWTISRTSETAPRSFSALGRDVDVPKAPLSFDRERRRLTYTAPTQSASSSPEVLEAIRSYLTDDLAEGRRSQRSVIDAMRGRHGKADVREALAVGAQNGALRAVNGANRAIHYYTGDSGDPVILGDPRDPKNTGPDRCSGDPVLYRSTGSDHHRPTSAQEVAS